MLVGTYRYFPCGEINSWGRDYPGKKEYCSWGGDYMGKEDYSGKVVVLQKKTLPY